ncbi:MAG: DMT family transporter [Pseudomonadota bacterium]
MSRDDAVARSSLRHVLWSRLWIYFALIFCGGIWGLVPTLAKSAVSDGAHPFGLTWWQAVGGGTMVLLISLTRGKRLPLDRQHIGFYVFCGIAGTIVPTLALFYSAHHVSAGIVAVLMASVAIAAYPLSIIFGIDRMQPVRVLGLCLGLAGVAMLILPGSGIGAGDPLWIVIALLIPFGYAAENVFVAIKSPRQTDTTTLVAGMLLMGGVMITPVVIATDTWYPITWPLNEAELAVIGIFVINVLSYVLFLALIYAAGPVFASMSGYFSVLTGIVWGMVLLGEDHGAWFWAALLSMLAGMALVRERAVHRRADTP